LKTNKLNGLTHKELKTNIEKVIKDIPKEKYENIIKGTYNWTKKDAHYPRISKTPFTKWYVKDYHIKYDIEKMFDAYISDNEEKRNYTET